MTAEEFKALRERAGFTQQAMADFLGVDIRTAQRYESTGADAIKIKGPVLKLCEILKERTDRRR